MQTQTGLQKKQKSHISVIKGYEIANAIALSSPDTLMVSIADREGDMYDLLQKMPSESNKAYWLVRSKHNREVLNETDNGLTRRLREAVRASKAVANIEFKMSLDKIHTQNARTRRERKERTVHQEIKACRVNKKKKICIRIWAIAAGLLQHRLNKSHTGSHLVAGLAA